MPIVEVNRDPEGYDETRGVVEAHLETFLPNFLAKLEFGSNELILDHGCGTGETLTKYLLPFAEKSNSIIYAQDNCKSMVEYGKTHRPHPNVKYVLGALTDANSPVKGMKFNKIFSIFTLMFIEDFNGVEAIVRSSCHREMLLFTVMECHMFQIFRHIKNLDKYKDLAEGHMVYPQWLDQTQTPFEILKSEILNLGLQIVEISEEERVHVYKHSHMYPDMIFALCGFAKHLPIEGQKELKELYRQLNLEIETKAHKPNANSPNCEYPLHYIPRRNMAWDPMGDCPRLGIL